MIPLEHLVLDVGDESEEDQSDMQEEEQSGGQEEEAVPVWRHYSQLSHALSARSIWPTACVFTSTAGRDFIYSNSWGAVAASRGLQEVIPLEGVAVTFFWTGRVDSSEDRDSLVHAALGLVAETLEQQLASHLPTEAVQTRWCSSSTFEARYPGIVFASEAQRRAFMQLVRRRCESNSALHVRRQDAAGISGMFCFMDDAGAPQHPTFLPLPPQLPSQLVTFFPTPAQQHLYTMPEAAADGNSHEAHHLALHLLKQLGWPQSLQLEELIAAAPLYEAQDRRDLPARAVRITTASTHCPIAAEGSHSCAHVTVDVLEARAAAVIRCGVCGESRRVSLDGEDRRLFLFYQCFWGWEHCWGPALNALYLQVETGSKSLLKRCTAKDGSMELRAAQARVALRGRKTCVWTTTRWELKDVMPEWLEWNGRSMVESIEFNPRLPHGISGRVFNTYAGFGVEPQAPPSGRLGDAAPVFRSFLAEVIAGGRADYRDYVLNCLSQLVRQPWKKLGVLLVLLSKEGAGKNTLVDTLCSIFGQHSLQITQSSQFTGNFNAHLRDSILVILSEAIWGGEKQSASALKAAVTDTFCMFEGKGVDAVRGFNCWTFMITSNGPWCVPAKGSSRRPVMLPVSNHRIGDKSYFDAVHAALAAGEVQQFLWYLLHRELPPGWKADANMPPRLRAHVDQMFQDRSQAGCKWLVQHLGEYGEWSCESFGLLSLESDHWRCSSGRVPIIAAGRKTRVDKQLVLRALEEATKEEPYLRQQVGTSLADVTKFFTDTLGSCFKADVRSRQSDGSRRRMFEFDSAQHIMAHLEEHVLQVANYFSKRRQPASTDTGRVRQRQRLS